MIYKCTIINKSFPNVVCRVDEWIVLLEDPEKNHQFSQKMATCFIQEDLSSLIYSFCQVDLTMESKCSLNDEWTPLYCWFQNFLVCCEDRPDYKKNPPYDPNRILFLRKIFLLDFQEMSSFAEFRWFCWTILIIGNYAFFPCTLSS